MAGGNGRVGVRAGIGASRECWSVESALSTTPQDWPVVVPQDGGKAGNPKRGYQLSVGAGIDASANPKEFREQAWSRVGRSGAAATALPIG